MLNLLVRLQGIRNRFTRDESGQDALEYLLVIGVIMLLVVAAVATGFGPDGLVADILSDISGEVTEVLGLNDAT